MDRMREKRAGKQLGAFLLAAAFLASVPAVAAEPASKSAKALFEAKCSLCHPLSRPLGKNKDRKGWTEDVTRMQKGNGCPITDGEARQIIDCLVAERGPAGR